MQFPLQRKTERKFDARKKLTKFKFKKPKSDIGTSTFV